MKDPRKLARQCFAVAASTTHDGERTAAIGRGEAICRKHGLDLDDFDIPGRRPSKARASSGREEYARAGSSYWGAVSPEEVYADLARMMREMGYPPDFMTGSYSRFHEYGRAPTGHERPFYGAEYRVDPEREKNREVAAAQRYMESIGGKVMGTFQVAPLPTWKILWGAQEYEATDDQLIELAATIKRRREGRDATYPNYRGDWTFRADFT